MCPLCMMCPRVECINKNIKALDVNDHKTAISSQPIGGLSSWSSGGAEAGAGKQVSRQLQPAVFVDSSRGAQVCREAVGFLVSTGSSLQLHWSQTSLTQ